MERETAYGIPGGQAFQDMLQQADEQLQRAHFADYYRHSSDGGLTRV
jgi:hypothetical protein